MENAEKAADAPLRARHVFMEFARTLWYLRVFLASLLAIFIVLSAVMHYAGGPVDTATRTPASLEQTLYFCSITALTIGYGDVVPTTTVGRIDSILLGVVGLLITGIVIAASVRAVQEASQRTATRD
ncbi:potassium channel family protein [Caballeronia sp.]|uniref:potassium channel family protein n=1 Tax=Caballeronia sp. TaxID=1931223 RepID=UPI003C4FB327